jgi:pimeloyl-ACP methyl ester carboxylesterase
VAEQAKSFGPATRVRTRRAYFDCRFGQLHVRTAFPTTGGFDEGVPLFCLHPRDASSRIFSDFLPKIADDRSVYAPDMPGSGESDASPELSYGSAAAAIADLAADLRLRQIDLLGYRFGSGAALDLASSRPELVRRLVLVASPPIDRLPPIKQETLVLRTKSGASDDAQWIQGGLLKAKFVDLAETSADVFAAPGLARQIGEFLAA